jgi:APA family basic amino acid/polyamine antiporter
MAKLKREIGLFEVTFFGIGVIIGAGIFALIGPAAGIAGNLLWISFIVAAIVSTFTGLSYAELSAMYPKAAAEYVYVLKAWRSKPLAFIIGWLIIVTGVVSAAAVSLGFAGYFNSMIANFAFPSMDAAAVKIFSSDYLVFSAAGLVAAMSFVSFLGIKESSRVNILLTCIEIVGLVLMIILGFVFGNFNKNFFAGPAGNFDFNAVLVAAGLIFFAYIGFEDIANISEETKNPKKVLPMALMIAIAGTTLLYVLISIATISLVDANELSGSSVPLAYAVSRTPLGTNLDLFISFTAIFATSGSVLIILVVAARMIYGMANERSLPHKLAAIHHKRHTPWLAVIFVMIFSIAFVMLRELEFVAKLTSLTALMTFAVVNGSLIWLRYKQPNAKRPFKAPLNIGKLPLTALLGLLSCSILIFRFDAAVLSFGAGVIILGLAIYKSKDDIL